MLPQCPARSQQHPARFACCSGGAQHAHTLTPVPCTHTPLMFAIMRCTHMLLARSHLCPAHVPHSHACDIALCTHPCTCMLPARNSALHTRPACTCTHACVGALHVCPHQCPTCTSCSHECCACTHARHTRIPITQATCSPQDPVHASCLQECCSHSRAPHAIPTCTSDVLTTCPLPSVPGHHPGLWPLLRLCRHPAPPGALRHGVPLCKGDGGG